MSAGSNGNLQRSAASVLDTVLRDNGGPTPTHSLVSNSPAINRGDAAYAGDTGLVLDQRGGPRVAGGRVDIGAVESGSTVVAGSASTYHATLASGLSNPSLEPAVWPTGSPPHPPPRPPAGTFPPPEQTVEAGKCTEPIPSASGAVARGPRDALDRPLRDGPFLQGGKIGFRQMAPLIAEYANLEVHSVVREEKPE